MNTYTLYISSSSSSQIQTLPLLEMEDHSNLSINMETVYNEVIPLYLIINWGDGKEETFDNDVYGTKYDNQLSLINYNPIFTTEHPHEYYPSATCLYKTMTIQILISYSDGHYSYFTQPIQIRTYDFYDSIGRMELLNVNILKNKLEYQFRTSDGMVEMKTVP